MAAPETTRAPGAETGGPKSRTKPVHHGSPSRRPAQGTATEVAAALEAVAPVVTALGKLGEGADHAEIVRGLGPVRDLRLDREGHAVVRETISAALRRAGVRAPAAMADAFLPTPRGDGDPDRQSQAAAMVELARAAGAELFHSGDEREFVTVVIDDHEETWPVRSKSSRGWLRRLFYESSGSPPGSQGVQDAVEMLAADALHQGEERDLAVRVGGDDAVVRIDLGDEKWRFVEITADGWTVRDGAAKHFRRSRGMEPLPEPVQGGSLSDLRRHLNARGDQEWRLLASWLIAAFRPRGPYPVLVIQGEHGSAKTTTCRMLRRCVDPGKAGLRTPPRELRDLAVAAEGAWVLGYDNLGQLSATLSDGLCRLATGSGFATRELYSDADEVIFEATRPILANGISDVATKPDLLDRAYVVTLPRFGDDRDQRPDSEVWAAFEDDLPRIMGGLCDVVAMALRRWSETTTPTSVRMQDALRWAEASSPLWTAPGTPTEAVRRARAEVNATTIESSPVAATVAALLTKNPGGWTGTATELLAALEAIQGDEITAALIRRKRWPGSPRALTAELDRLAPVLRVEGMDFRRLPKSGKDGRRLQLENAPTTPSPQSPQSPGPENPNDSGDLRGDGVGDGGVTVGDGPARQSPDSHPDSHPASTWNHSGGDGGDGGDCPIRPHSAAGGHGNPERRRTVEL